MFFEILLFRRDYSRHNLSTHWLTHQLSITTHTTDQLAFSHVGGTNVHFPVSQANSCELCARQVSPQFWNGRRRTINSHLYPYVLRHACVEARLCDEFYTPSRWKSLQQTGKDISFVNTRSSHGKIMWCECFAKNVCSVWDFGFLQDTKGQEKTSLSKNLFLSQYGSKISD